MEGEKRPTGWPSTRIEPLLGGVTPDRSLTSVLFPEPFSPRIA